MDMEFVQFLSTMGVGGMIAGLIFMAYRKDIKQYTELWRSQTEIMTQVVKENTASITANTETIKALHRRMDIELVEFDHPPHRQEPRS